MRPAVRRLTGHKVSQTRSNARSFLNHFLTPWEPVYSIEVIIFSMPIYMLLSGAEECGQEGIDAHHGFRSCRTVRRSSCKVFVSMG